MHISNSGIRNEFEAYVWEITASPGLPRLLTSLSLLFLGCFPSSETFGLGSQKQQQAPGSQQPFLKVGCARR